MSARALRKREIGTKMMAEAGKKKVKMTKTATGSASKSANRKGSKRGAARTTMELLENLPSFNKNNFSNFQPSASHKPAVKKSKDIVSTKDHPFEQIIVTEKSTIELKFLQQQYEKKRAQMKFDAATAGPSGMSSRKRSRI